ncbi:MAG: sensor histidine kinase [Haloarculaceae archaeon]
MSNLIETMRTFMNAIVADADHETYPVDVRSELESEVALARDAYPDAVIEVRDFPGESTRAVADDLVGEVFENVLSNAVVHNDGDAPHVEVWASETTHEVRVDPESGEVRPARSPVPTDASTAVRARDAIAVHVADDGPGISDAEKEAVLEKGVSELSEPGNGFGPYLVKEMMQAYGGTVDIRDADGSDGGTVFDLVFLRPEPSGET